jgi:phosphatidylglycerophosphatase A
MRRRARPQGLASLIATVGGLGRAPVAPGTWGSLVGLLVGAMSLRLARAPSLLILLAVAWCLGAFLCALAERELNRHDPPAVILDEVLGMAAVVIVLPWTLTSWGRLAIAFLLFRAFDVSKPPPVRQLACLPGGWGIMADDAGAAAYTALALLILHRAGL